MRRETRVKNDKMRDLAKVRRRKIIIQKHTIAEDEWGNETKSWEVWKTVWAERGSLWGQAYYAAKAVNEETTIEFVLKYAPFVESMDTVEYRVLFEGNAYPIEHIDHLRDDGQWIKLKCLRSGADG